jgi:hypothetical protein
VRSLAECQEQFGFHPATPDTAPRHAAVRSALAQLAADLWDVIPDGPEKTLAMRSLQQAGMYANLAIALTAPLDETTSAVARVLPS